MPLAYLAAPSVKALARAAYDTRFANPRRALRLALRAARRARTLPDGASALAYARSAVGAAYCLLSQLDTAEAELSEAAALFQGLGDIAGLAITTSWRGGAQMRRRNLAAAMQMLLEAQGLARTACDQRIEADILLMIGAVHIDLMSYQRAAECFHRAIEIYERIADERHVALALGNLAIIYNALQNFNESLRSIDRCLEYSDRFHLPLVRTLQLGNRGLVLEKLGRNDEAVASLQSALEGARALRLSNGEMWVLNELGGVHLRLGMPAAARAYHELALELCVSFEDLHGRADALTGIGLSLLVLGQNQEAVPYLSTGSELADAHRLDEVGMRAHQGLADAYESLDDPHVAIRHLRLSIDARSRIADAERDARATNWLAMQAVERVEREGRLRAIRAELQLLKAQLQPHFVLNVLNSASAVLPGDPNTADRMICGLGALLRLSIIQSAQPDVTLSEELDFVRLYVEIEELRRVRSISLSVDLEPGTEEAIIPHLLLQPLVENSIQHGLGEAEPGGVWIRARRATPGELLVEVTDDGRGLASGWTLDEAGVGLRNTIERLRLLYRENHGFEVRAEAAGGVTAAIRIPFRLHSIDEPSRSGGGETRSR